MYIHSGYQMSPPSTCFYNKLFRHENIIENTQEVYYKSLCEYSKEL